MWHERTWCSCPVLFCLETLILQGCIRARSHAVKQVASAWKKFTQTLYIWCTGMQQKHLQVSQSCGQLHEQRWCGTPWEAHGNHNSAQWWYQCSETFSSHQSRVCSFHKFPLNFLWWEQEKYEYYQTIQMMRNVAKMPNLTNISIKSKIPCPSQLRQWLQTDWGEVIKQCVVFPYSAEMDGLGLWGLSLSSNLYI